MYHVNPTTGNVGICRAGSGTGNRASGGGCPFGNTSEHHDTPEGARNAYEASMRGATLQVLKKSPKTQQEDNSISKPPANKSLAKFKFDKAEFRYQNAVSDLNQNGSASRFTAVDIEQLKSKRDIAESQLDSFSEPTQQKNSSKKEVQNEFAQPLNLAKARFEFDKAELDYQRIEATYNDTNEPIPLSTDGLYNAMQKRDKLAAKLGLPTLMSRIDSEGAEKREKRDKTLKALKQLRTTLKSNEVGPGTDRERLYKVESAFLSANTGQHPISGSHELRAPAKEIWEVAHSVAKYEVESRNEQLNELNRFSLAMSPDKRRIRKNKIEWEEKQVSFYQGRLEEAETALKNPNAKYPYDDEVGTDRVPTVARFW